MNWTLLPSLPAFHEGYFQKQITHAIPIIKRAHGSCYDGDSLEMTFKSKHNAMEAFKQVETVDNCATARFNRVP